VLGVQARPSQNLHSNAEEWLQSAARNQLPSRAPENAINNTARSYVLFFHYTKPTNRHVVPSFEQLATIGGQAFPVAATKLWNALPNNVVSASSINSFWHQVINFSVPAIVLLLAPE